MLNIKSISPYQYLQESSEYDPHSERVVSNPIGNLETFINLIKCAIGTGCLAMPMAFMHAGWVPGIIATFVIAYLIVYTMHILIANIYLLCKRHHIPTLSYTDAMNLAIRNGPSWIQQYNVLVSQLIDVFLGFYHFAASTVYVVFVAENCKQIADYHEYEYSLRTHMFFLLPIFVLLSQIKDLKTLVPFSGIANILFFTGIAGIMYYIFQDLPPLSEREKFKPIQEFPLFFGIVLFSIESVGIIVSIENQMACPKCYLGWCGILNRGMICVILLYISFGFLGYWRFGEETKSSVTLNLPAELMISQVIKFLFAAAIILSHPMQVMVTKNIIWESHLKRRVPQEDQWETEILLRATIAIASVLCAAGMPHLGLLLSLAGSFCLSVLGIICPAIMDICVCYGSDLPNLKASLSRDIVFIIFGFISGILGTWVAFRNLAMEFQDDLE